MDSMTLGTRVKHPKYGYGTILRLEGNGDDLKVTISFVSHGLRKMIAKHAELEIITDQKSSGFRRRVGPARDEKSSQVPLLGIFMLHVIGARASN